MISPELLRRYAFFAGLSDMQLKQIALISREATFQPNGYIFREGETADTLYLIVEGSVSILIDIDGEGSKREALSELHAGELLAWSAIVPPYRLTASAMANIPTRSLATDAAKLRALLAQDCEMSAIILSRLVGVLRDRLTATRVQLVSLAVRPNPE